MFPAYLDQLDQHLARSPIANFDAHDSNRMAAAARLRCHGIQGAFPQPASGHGNVMMQSLVMQRLDQLIHELRWFKIKLLMKK